MDAGEADCRAVRAGFSSYLDGALSGVEMGRMAEHLESCAGCDREFQAWRTVQTALGDLGPAKAPVRLQARLRAALAMERERGSYLPAMGRIARRWKTSVAPLALQGAGGLVAAVLLMGGLFRLFGPGVMVQANDDDMAHLIAPHYLYSQVPAEPIVTVHEVPILVEAKVDTRGRVYDYTILDGPQDAAVRMRVEQNLLSSVFRPATVFGVPVDGHVMLTYTGVSVRG
ncbi:MAG TPA: zf-HC2 domain-containing protein [Acidobacteriaceae bacterium]|jgi:anti-sigma factor RsiW|nr:zf-HC2 domain-containing protein [Acidobacteriaceae bacterium]